MNTKINVIDLECTCWINEPQPMGMIQEILEIGIVQIDLNKVEIVQSESILVKPTLSKISWSCTHLTNITDEMVKDAMTFPDATDRMIKIFNTKRLLWASYGNFDRNMFETQCKLLNVEYPLSDQHVNIKAVMRSVYPDVKGLSSALNKFKMQFEGLPHRGIDDAKNTAKIYMILLKLIKRGFEHGSPPVI